MRAYLATMLLLALAVIGAVLIASMVTGLYARTLP